MLIRYHGHSEFLIEGAGGLRILTDPYDPRIPFPQKEVQADVVTISHEHLDHCYTDKLLGEPMLVRGPGSHAPREGLSILGIDSYHDDAQGQKRGHNTIFIIQLEGLRIAHLGDLGAPPEAAGMEALRGADILMVPVGGTYTLDALEAAALVRQLQPRIVIPMHYKRGEQGLQNIGAADGFLAAMAPLQASEQPLLRVVQEDISEAPPLVLLTPQA